MSLSSSILRKVDASKKSGILNLRQEGLTELSAELYNRSTGDNWFDVRNLTRILQKFNAVSLDS